MTYAPREAIAACGHSKSSVLRALKSGTISDTRNAHDGWQPESVELHRLLPVASPARTLQRKLELAEERVSRLQWRLELAKARVFGLRQWRLELAEERVSRLEAELRLAVAEARAYRVQAELADAPTPRDARNSQPEAQLFDEEAHVVIKEVLDALPNGSAITFSADQLEVLFSGGGPVLADTKTPATIIERFAHTYGCSFALHGDTGTFTKNLIDAAASAQMNVPRSAIQIGFEEEKGDKMFGKSNGNSHEEDKLLPPVQQLQNCARQMRIVLDSVFHGDRKELYNTYRMARTRAAAEDIDDRMGRRHAPQWLPEQLAPTHLAASESAANSSIGPGVTVVGKISSEGIVNVFGRVEGELHASIVWVSDGARVEGTIAAQELTIGGRFKGTIQANRVTLTSSAVVEGEIHSRSLVIEENAWFAGVSHPEEASAGGTDEESPIQLGPTYGNRQVNGSLVKEVRADTAND